MSLYLEKPENKGLTKEERIKKLADWLIYTLGTGMTAQKADKIVKEVALLLYNDILGIKGEIVSDIEEFLYNDPSGDCGVKCKDYINYKFKEKDI